MCNGNAFVPEINAVQDKDGKWHTLIECPDCLGHGCTPITEPDGFGICHGGPCPTCNGRGLIVEANHMPSDYGQEDCDAND